MSETVAGFPFWELRFDKTGVPVAGRDELLAGLPAAGLTDLFVFSHGWNNDRPTALRLYERFFAEVRGVLDQRPAPGRTFGVVGVVWPSMRWVDEVDPEDDGAGGAAGLGGAEPGDREAVEALKAVFDAGPDHEALDALAELLEQRPDDEAELGRFQVLVAGLVDGPDAADSAEDNHERELLESDPEDVFRSAARAARAPADAGGVDAGGAAVLGDLGEPQDPDDDAAAGLGTSFGRLWDGARQALRQATYWEMKKRAGFVGRDGLAPVLNGVHQLVPALRLHLVGHSFGARLVSFSLVGLTAGGASPVKSLLLLQGAFSHYAFAEALPHDPARSGALGGMAGRVDGPLVVTHSVFDLATGRLYPVASLAAGEDAAAMEDLLLRWGAMGHDGAQAVDAAATALGPVGEEYQLVGGAFLNLDARGVIAHGRPPAGAHTDIFHPELAWVCLSAAGAAV